MIEIDLIVVVMIFILIILFAGSPDLWDAVIELIRSKAQ